MRPNAGCRHSPHLQRPWLASLLLPSLAALVRVAAEGTQSGSELPLRCMQGGSREPSRATSLPDLVPAASCCGGAACWKIGGQARCCCCKVRHAQSQQRWHQLGQTAIYAACTGVARKVHAELLNPQSSFSLPVWMPQHLPSDAHPPTLAWSRRGRRPASR